MSHGAAPRPPLGLGRLGWRQFDDLCAALLELDGGVEPDDWRGHEPGERYVQRDGDLTLPGGGAIPGPCHVQTAWVPATAADDRAVTLREALADVHRHIAGDEGSVVLMSNVDAVDHEPGLVASVFVPTGAYRRSLAVLAAHHFAVLTGPPEMGKTATARMIALALMSDGWEAH